MELILSCLIPILVLYVPRYLIHFYLGMLIAQEKELIRSLWASQSRARRRLFFLAGFILYNYRYTVAAVPIAISAMTLWVARSPLIILPLAAMGLLAATIALSLLFYALVEKPSIQLGRAAISLLSRRRGKGHLDLAPAHRL